MVFTRNSASRELLIFECGGSIRDSLLGLKSKDRDFVCLGTDFDGLKDFILLNGGKIFLERPEFLTVRAKLPGIGDADFVIGRAEGAYRDGRHPSEVIACATIEQELSRRDFGTNAMAINVETGELVDPFNGREDTLNKVLRCVGNTEQRMAEDGLRILRAVRFHVVKGFSLAPELESFLLRNDTPDFMGGVSAERIREELAKCFSFDTLETLRVLEKFWRVRNHIFSRNLRLTPAVFAVK